MDVDDVCFFLNWTVCRMCAESNFLLCGYQKVCVASVVSTCFPVNYCYYHCSDCEHDDPYYQYYYKSCCYWLLVY